MGGEKITGGIYPSEIGTFIRTLTLHLFLLPFRVFEIG